ncbi:hypothetical protein DUI87_01673 [Hirundo rustica rustica]|uniref:ribonuclease H n=1 Tax=Hirundo rustica rustica TaxID=333673 RepID=A0A3M0LCP0_HIRRU|nr:hypothetical protein DUI87_01673 [Hirundo rustica rustica]
MYSGLDPETPLGQALLKTQFVAKSWEDIRKKLEKFDNWQDRDLDELLREAQKVYVRRDEESHKRQVRMMVAAVRETRRIDAPPKTSQVAQRNGGGVPWVEKKDGGICFYCGNKGHFRRNCRKRLRDERVFKEDRRSQGLHLLGTRKHQEPLIKLKIGPQQQEFEFLVDTGAERSTVQADGSYRLVHDLREINKRTVARFPVVANPYTLLSRLGPEKQYYSVIDLKDAFWACPLDEKSRDYFAFEWEDPVTHRRQQLRWTVLPQGFTESPNLFGQALEQILQEYQTGEGVTLIQYVDDLLIAGEAEDKVRAESIRLLNFLSAKGLKVSKAKLQFVEEEVKYLGHYLRKGEKKIDPERVKGILSIPPPKSKKQIRQLLGLMGYCRQWIENYSTKVKFLYEKLSQGGLVKWDEKDDKHLKALRHDLVNAPVLSLPDLKRPFYLFVNTDSGTAYGVLTQEWAGKKKPVGYLSKLLDPGYKNSPTIFGEQLAKDLESWEPPPGEGQLLQYVDDLIIATQTQETCVDWTVSLLNFLGLQGYRVSQKKAQMVRQTVIYLGYEVSAGQRTLGHDRKEAICQTPKPQTVKELRTFLGMTGWYRLWIYNYGLLVKPLYALITEGSRDLQWTKDATRAFDQLKKALMSAPALGLPNVSKPFFLFSHEKQGIALGILAQNLGPYRRAVAYLSKQLDTAAKGWPGCLRAVAAVAINIQEARKFTLGQKMTVLVSHTMSAVLEAKGGHWLSPQRFLKYQAILVEQDDVEIVVTNTVNPASFLSGSMGEPVIHDCLETIEATYSSRPDLKDTPLEDAETWFTDGSSYFVSGRRHAGYAVTTSKEVIESGPLPTNTSTQKAEIIALIRALELAKGKEINIYTDSRYAFGVVHAHGAIWKEGGLLNSQGKSIKHAQEILRLLDAIQLPERVAIMHIKAHQKVSSELEEGNMLADREAKEAAKGEVPDKAVEAALIPDGKVSIEGWPEAFPARTAKAREVIKALLQEIIPRFGVLATISSDRGPHFISKIVQQISHHLGINWELHTPYHPQSSGQLEKMNHLIKQQIVRLGQEANLPWPQALLLALLRIRTKPRAKEKLSPFKILYGRPYAVQGGTASIQVGEETLHGYMVALNKQLREIEKYVAGTQNRELDGPVHDVQPGGYVYVKSFAEKTLEPQWEGPFQVPLITFTAIKIKEQKAWIHHSRVKKAPEGIWKATPGDNELKLRLTQNNE